MRFALRNKKKLVEKLGQGFYQTLINSLKNYAETNEELTIGDKVNDKDSILVNHKDQTFQFVIIRKTFDVYTVAYYSTIK